MWIKRLLKKKRKYPIDKLPIVKNKCTPKHHTGYPAGYFDSIDVDTSNFSSEIGKIVLYVNWVDRMRAGLSFVGTNFVAICTKAWWQNISTQK